MITDNVYIAVRYVPLLSGIVGVGLRDVVIDHTFHAEAVYLFQGIGSTRLCYGTIDCPRTTVNVVVNDLIYNAIPLHTTHNVITDDPWGWFYDCLLGQDSRDLAFLPTYYLPQAMVLDAVRRTDLTAPQCLDTALDRLMTIWILDHDETTVTLAFCRYSTSTTMTLPLNYAGQVPTTQFLLENLDVFITEAILHGIGDVHRGGGS